MAEVINVTLNKTDSSSGLGFSLLGTPGFPPVIYDIIENSPAAESGQVSKIQKTVTEFKSCMMFNVEEWVDRLQENQFPEDQPTVCLTFWDH